MNLRQQRFIEEYLVDLNATKAAERAGYSEKTAGSQGERLLKNVEIKAAIEAAQQKRLKKIEITAEWVLRRLVKEAKRAEEGSSHGARVRAIELLGKHVGMFGDKLHLTGDVKTGPRIDLKKLNDEQLAQLDSILAAAGIDPATA